MTTIIGFEPIHMAILIAVFGVLLHNLRTYKAGKGINWKRKTEASLTMFVGSVYAVHQILIAPGNLALPDVQQLTLVLGQIGGIAGFGLLGQKVFDKARAKVTTQQPRQEDPIPAALTGNGWYKTNFTRGDAGNTLPYGSRYLYVEVPEARNYVTAILRDANNNAIQIEQSNPGSKSVRLEMFDRAGQLLARGRYSLQIRSDVGPGDSQGITDTFEIA